MKKHILIISASFLLTACATNAQYTSAYGASVNAGGVEIQASVAPPPIPDYPQPPCPGPGYIWIPGYWGFNNENGYYWVPGEWEFAPRPGYLWTPGYWALEAGFYNWVPGYWGTTVGYYGGINYGHGYFGNGFYGGRWERNTFVYNTAVTNVNTTVIHNTYIDNHYVVNNNRTAFTEHGGFRPGQNNGQPNNSRNNGFRPGNPQTPNNPQNVNNGMRQGNPPISNNPQTQNNGFRTGNMQAQNNYPRMNNGMRQNSAQMQNNFPDRLPPTPAQQAHIQSARQNPQLFYNTQRNNPRPEAVQAEQQKMMQMRARQMQNPPRRQGKGGFGR